jgi:hypothetical protein
MPSASASASRCGQRDRKRASAFSWMRIAITAFGAFAHDARSFSVEVIAKTDVARSL